MKKIVLPLLFLVGLSFTSCIDFKTKKSVSEVKIEDFNTVNVNEDYQISIPPFMTGTTGLNEEASLQYQNIREEAYTIVIDEPKDEFVQIFKQMGSYDDNLSLLENYRNIQLQFFEQRMQINDQSDVTSQKINGLDAESVEIDSNVNGIDEELSYFLTFVEGPENVYMIMSWTLKDKKENHRTIFEAIASSFGLIR